MPKGKVQIYLERRIGENRQFLDFKNGRTRNKERIVVRWSEAFSRIMEAVGSVMNDPSEFGNLNSKAILILISNDVQKYAVDTQRDYELQKSR